jgi:lysophospholipid acyltransferase (LPLAT)-like uncharacterized protein
MMHDTMDKIPLDAVSASIFIIGEIIGRTWRFSVDGRGDYDPFHDCGKGCIYAFWHSSLLPLAFYFRNTAKTAIISESRDGTRAAAVAQRWGHTVIHGSSSHGGAPALRSCIRALKSGSTIVITPDGPRGPREIVKKGVAQIALLSGAPVIPVSVVAENALRLNSWDRTMIPLPFSKVVVRIGEPLRFGKNAEKKIDVDRFTGCIQKALAP